MRFTFAFIAAATLVSGSLPSWAASYYVAPVGAKVLCPGDGSAKCPWSSLSVAFGSKKVVGGDTILLMDGDHGSLDAKVQFASQVTIQSQNAKNARITSANFQAAKNIRLKNLSIWRNEGEGAGFLVRAYADASYLTFEDLDMRSRKDATDYLKWGAARWLEVAGSGFDLRGTNYIIRNNIVRGTRVGIIAGSDSLVEKNVVDGFSGDGMKGVSRSVFRFNLVKNGVKVDDYHGDGFQAFTKSTLSNLMLDSNVIISWSGPKDHPLRGYIQGIGLFDGMYDNLLIQNNIVVVEHSHGISVYGTRNAKILNNTVVNLSGLPNKYPIIRVKRHKDGRPSENVLVANNVAMKFEGGDAAYNVVFKNNSVIAYPARVFADVANFNYMPKADSGFIDTGLPASPRRDLRNYLRPAGKAPDRGAYETGSTLADTSAIGGPTDTTARWMTP